MKYGNPMRANGDQDYQRKKFFSYDLRAPLPSHSVHQTARILSTVFLIILVSIFGGVPSGHASTFVYDDFNGESINQNLWNINDPSGIYTQSGGYLRANTPPNGVFGELSSKEIWSGDFDIILEYLDFMSTATQHVVCHSRIALGILSTEGNANTNFILIARSYNRNDQHTFDASGMVGGIWLPVYQATASTPYGQLKISRVGSTITAYSKENGDWVLVGTFDNVFTGGVRVWVDAYTGDNGTFQVKVDNVLYQPQQNWNNPPVPDAGPNISIESEEQSTTIIQGTASDPNGDPLIYRWLEGTKILQGWKYVSSGGDAPLNLGTLQNFSKGSHTLVLQVSDLKVISKDEMILTIGNSAPHAAPSGGGTYQVNTPVILGGQVSDFDGDQLSYQWLEGETVLYSGIIQSTEGGAAVSLPDDTINDLAVGTHTLELQVSDGINQPVFASINVEVIDTIAPTLAPVADKTILWPPNHKMENITIWPNASDNSGGAVSLTAFVSSNEPQDGLGDGDEYPDWTEPEINNGIITLQLRAERSGKGNGRTYTITIIGTDSLNNSSTATINIVVPHDKEK